MEIIKEGKNKDLIDLIIVLVENGIILILRSFKLHNFIEEFEFYLEKLNKFYKGNEDLLN